MSSTVVDEDHRVEVVRREAMGLEVPASGRRLERGESGDRPAFVAYEKPGERAAERTGTVDENQGTVGHA